MAPTGKVKEFVDCIAHSFNLIIGLMGKVKEYRVFHYFFRRRASRAGGCFPLIFKGNPYIPQGANLQFSPVREARRGASQPGLAWLGQPASQPASQRKIVWRQTIFTNQLGRE